jgi:hypothetical protein
MPDARGVSQEISSSPSNLSDVSVAIYGGVGILSSSMDALENMFLWMNAS